MEVVNKLSDVNEMFNKVEKAFENFQLPKQGDKYERLAIEVVNGLIVILKKLIRMSLALRLSTGFENLWIR